MANKKSAEKRIKQNQKKRANNRLGKSKMKDAIKKFKAILLGGNKDNATTAFRDVQKAIAISADKSIVHKNTGARYISRLATMLNKMA